MTREEVASDELRAIVGRWRTNGIPQAIPYEELPPKTGKQEEIIEKLFVAVEQQKRTKAGEELPEEGSERYCASMKIRSCIQEAIVAGLGDAGFGIILRQMENYGAVPMADPEVKGKEWKWFLLPNGDTVCWECGSVIMQKRISNSVWLSDGPGPCAGTGEVRSGGAVPYCPKCDPEPTNGVVYETIADCLGDEIATALGRPGRYD